MALNLADSADIMAAYEAVLNNELNWYVFCSLGIFRKLWAGERSDVI